METDNLKTFKEQILKLQQDLGITITVTLDFPEYKILPDDVKLALNVLSKHKKNYVIIYVDKNAKKEIA